MEFDRSSLSCRRRNRSFQSLAGGGIIVVIGLLLLLNNMHVIRVRELWDFWPLILVVFGAARIMESRSSMSALWGSIVAGMGVLLFLDNLEVFRFNLDFVWPLVLIGAGLVMLTRSMERQRLRASGGVATLAAASTISVIFSGAKRRITSPDFRGIDVLALFGGVDLDLRGSRVEIDQATIDINAMFGGVKVTVPDNWNVVVKGFGMFGAFEDKTIPPRADPNVKTQELVISGVALFGGVNVRN